MKASFGPVAAGFYGGLGAAWIGHPGPLLVDRPRPSFEAETRRTKIWELAPSLHCSIIGTCLATADLRAILRKFGVLRDELSTEHDLHSIAVSAVGKHDLLAKQFNKALDRKHKAAISAFGAATTADALRELWDNALQQGDIPGAYWALLTHHATTEILVKRVFGDVHMLSHLVGAANRADIRRLRAIEQENTALAEKVARQQLLLNEAIAARDAKIRELNAALSAQISAEAGAPRPDSERRMQDSTVLDLVADLRRQLGVEQARRERAERARDEALTARTREQSARLNAETEAETLRGEMESAEARIAAWLDTGADRAADRLDLRGMTVLYVGGRPHQVVRLRSLVERASGEFLHHDGGVEEKTDLLPGLMSRADGAFLPVDCISHEAAQSVKRLCRQMGKPFMPLRSASATSFLHALQASTFAQRGAEGGS